MKKTYFYKLLIVLISVLCLTTLSSCAKEETTTKYSSVDQLHNVKFGIVAGNIFDTYLAENYPDCEVYSFSQTSDTYMAVEEGKVLAFWLDGPKAVSIVRERSDLYYLEDDNFVSPLGFAFSKNDQGMQLQKEMNDFLKNLYTSGMLEKLQNKWIEDQAVEAVSDKDLVATNGTLKASLACDNAPFLFHVDNGLGGLEYDLLVRFCKEYGYALDIEDSNFEGVVASVASGKCDIAAAGITITDERKKSFLFSDTYYVCNAKVLMLKENLDVEVDALTELSNKNIGVITGTIAEDVVKTYLPNATITYYNSTSDIVLALNQGKIDASNNDEAVFQFLQKEFPDIELMTTVDRQEYTFLIARTDFGSQIRNQIEEFCEKCEADGTLEALRNKWLSDYCDEDFDLESLDNTNGTIKAILLEDGAPFSYIYRNKTVGLDVEVIYRFAQEYHYGLELEYGNAEAVIATVASGKADMALGGFVYTEERAERFLFGGVTYIGGNAFFKTNAASSTNKSILEELKYSFERTFIKEDRYKLFIDGIKSTIFITLMAVLLGTILGTLFFAIFRTNSKILNFLVNTLDWLVKSMPTVVLLMILYYIIFAKSSIEGIWVSIIAFTLIFSITVLGIFKTCFMAIDKGQYEACYALGYKRLQTFFKIILPQMGPMFIPSYSSEIVSLIKATSIVGYIAVQDLTKVTDIVRSRTYEAFFPLIATTVIYIIIMTFFRFVLAQIAKMVDPTRRSKKTIMKGVKLHD